MISAEALKAVGVFKICLSFETPTTRLFHSLRPGAHPFQIKDAQDIDRRPLNVI